jgi:hypothetical protein
MDLDLTPDQAGLLDAISKLTTPFANQPPGAARDFLVSMELDDRLTESGFRDVARFDGMGVLEAVLLAEVVAALPYVTEFAASAIVAPRLGIPAGRPTVLMRRPLDAPVRFLIGAGTALIADGDDVRVMDLACREVEPLTVPFGYPLGRLRSANLAGTGCFPGAAPKLLQWWHVALATEIGAAARAAVELTVQYVKDRRQFGHAIGSYQAVQHRLSECSVVVEAIRQLTRRAAATEDVQDALIAASYAKEACARIIYDTQQFHGAIGVTYEYPLHLWTYRLRLLQGELGSFADTASTLAEARWS